MTNKETSTFSERPQINNPRFVLLLGPSGVGKSTIIDELHELDDRIQFVSPIMDRPARPGETEKTSIGKNAFSDLEHQGLFLVVNNVYGHRYGTPASTIDTILRDGRIPILDYPLSRIDQLSQYESILYNIYIIPPSFGSLRKRMENDERDTNGSRLDEAKIELTNLIKIHFRHPDINSVVINRHQVESAHAVLNYIYEAVT